MSDARKLCILAGEARTIAKLAKALSDALREEDPDAKAFIHILDHAVEDGEMIGRHLDLKAQESLLKARQTGWKE